MNSNSLKKSTFLYLILFVLLSSFSDPYSIRRISDMNFRYEFYTTDKKINPKKNRMYYWFKGGLIHNSQSGIVGDLLDDTFIKLYHSNQLAEQGQFRNGLKIGLWKTWHPNGKISTIQYWKNGFKTGNYYCYDENGVMTTKGFYRNDKMNRLWIDYAKKDTLEYKKGIVVLKKQSLSKLEKYKLKQDAILAKRNQNDSIDTKKVNDANTLTQYKVKAKEDNVKYKGNKKIIKQKLASDKKLLKEKKKATKEKEKQERKNQGGSKTKIFLKKLWNKIKPKQKNNAKSA